MSDIILNGRAGAGKDVVADYLVEKHGYVKIAFADGIYFIAREYFNMQEKDRKLVQSIGEHMRAINPNVWVEYTDKKHKELKEQGYRVVISDCRRANEYEHFVNNLGFNPIRVRAGLDNRVKRIEMRDGAKPDTSLLENESEIGADSFSYTEIENNGSLEDLYKKIDKVVDKL